MGFKLCLELLFGEKNCLYFHVLLGAAKIFLLLGTGRERAIVIYTRSRLYGFLTG